MEVIAMPVKKNLSSAKKPNKVAVKRHEKLVAPKGEKVSSMKAALSCRKAGGTPLNF
jgi:hypothetical protein